ncbi:MAG: 3-hydroxyacyl-CoA dehydrogenase NAD-binding domain-containing protein [Chloroflexota bacterium]
MSHSDRVMDLPSDVQKVAVIGTGVIGGGWVAHFLRQGLRVNVWDPDPETEAKLRDRLDDVWPVLERLGLRDGASRENLSVSSSLSEAVQQAQFVQECVPERLPIKIDTLRQIDAVCPRNTVIASSTSGYLMTEMAIECHYPDRCVVAHPFNPPYLMPVVEVVAGEKTSDVHHQWAVDFYRVTGKKPLKLSKEVPGFVADRIMEAVWREILHMLDNDMATVAEIEAAVRYGPGLRWAMMGPLTVLHLGGGEKGMAHLIHQFGPSLKAPWTFLEAPELTDDLTQKVIDGCEDLTDGRPIRQLEQERDDLLIRLIEMLEQSNLWHVGSPNT